MGSHADAEDVVQEAFLRAFAALETLRGSARPWLLTIVRNTALTCLSRRGHSSRVADEAELAQVREPSAGPEALAMAASDRERVRGALAELPAEFREALVLREMEGFSYREIASITGIPLGTVMSRLSRGREWLKRLLMAPQKEVAGR